MKINSSEFNKHISEYLKKSNDEEIVITRYGKPIARVMGMRPCSREVDLESIFGVLPKDYNEKQVLADRLLAI